jgi:hypothetical protein
VVSAYCGGESVSISVHPGKTTRGRAAAREHAAATRAATETAGSATIALATGASRFALMRRFRERVRGL